MNSEREVKTHEGQSLSSLVIFLINSNCQVALKVRWLHEDKNKRPLLSKSLIRCIFTYATKPHKTASCIFCISFGTWDVYSGVVAESYLYSSALILYYSIDLCTNAMVRVRTRCVWNDREEKQRKVFYTWLVLCRNRSLLCTNVMP